jgi:hypothetical protein
MAIANTMVTLKACWEGKDDGLKGARNAESKVTMSRNG